MNFPRFSNILFSIILFLELAIFAWADQPCSKINAGGVTYCASLIAHLPNNLPQGMQATVSSNGGFCLNRANASSGNYAYCGSNPFNISIQEFTWDTLRGMIALSNRLPGQYSGYQGEIASENLNQQLKSIQNRINNYAELAQDVDQSLKKYLTETLIPTTREFTQHVAHARVEVEEAMQNLPMPTVDKIDTSPLTDAEQTKLAQLSLLQISPELSDEISNLENPTSNPIEKWNQIDRLRRVLQESEIELSQEEQNQIQHAIEPYYNPNSLVSSKIVTHETAKVSRLIGEKLASSIETPEGREVRSVINRGLVLYSGATSTEAKEVLLGGIGFALGADQAFADGHSPNGWSLLSTSAALIDFAVSLTPLSAINDSAQIVSGLATGYDYTGQRMEKYDYALRGIGIALAVVPFGNAAVKIGNRIIDSAFVWGATLVRNLRLEEKFFKQASSSVNDISDITKVIGDLFPSTSAGTAADISELSSDISRTIDHLTTAKTPEQWVGVKQLSETLRDQGLERKDRIKVIKSFSPGTIEVKTAKSGTLIYRWHNNTPDVKQFGRFFAFQEIRDEKIARATLALPEQNFLKFLDRFIIEKDAIIFTGNVASALGQKGGGLQVFVPGSLKDLIKFEKRIIGQ